MPSSRTARAITGRSAGSGAAAHARGDEHHVGPGQVLENLVDRFLGGAAADLGLGARAQTLGEFRTELNLAVRLRLVQRLGVGVRHDEADAFELGRDHVVDGVAAGPADAEHSDPRFELGDFGRPEINRHNVPP